jgi:hypothetical protein
MTTPERRELSILLGLERPVHCQGCSIPAGASRLDMITGRNTSTGQKAERRA